MDASKIEKENNNNNNKNKQTNKQNFHDSSRGNFYGLNKNPQLNQSQKVKCTKKYTSVKYDMKITLRNISSRNS